MVHARYGSKDAVLDAFFLHEYIKQLSPDPDPDATGLQQASAHFDRDRPARLRRPGLSARDVRRHVRGGEDDFATAPAVQRQLDVGIDKVEAGLRRRAIDDGSVRATSTSTAPINDISAAVFGIAYLWTVLADGYDLDRELRYVRDRFIRDYGSTAR